MAQALQFQFGSDEFSCTISKVDRSKLYGSVQVEALDEEGQRCSLATLAGDGKTLIPMGGTALAYFSPDGMWRDKDSLKPVDLDGNEITPVTSTFKLATPLVTKATYEEYLSHNAHLIYQLNLVGDAAFPSALVEELNEGTIYQFPFSYRGGLEADQGFLLAGADGVIWMVVGKKTDIQFVGSEQAGTLVVEEEDASDDGDESMEFGF